MGVKQQHQFLEISPLILCDILIFLLHLLQMKKMINSKELDNGVKAQKLSCQAKGDRFYECRVDNERVDFKPDTIEMELGENKARVQQKNVGVNIEH